MKSYIDLGQSKKLAEFLPLESADMWYSYYGNSTYNPTIAYNGEQWFLCQIRNSLHGDIPCWSLAALFDILPLEIETHKQTDGYKIYYYVETYMRHKGKEIYLSTERHEKLIDACVAMIERLHKLKML